MAVSSNNTSPMSATTSRGLGMSGEWREVPFSDAVHLNPSTKLEKDVAYPFVDMAAVSAGTRDVTSSELRPFSGGGSKFQHRDTLMARITPCLENGKIARFLATDGEHVGHGSTEFIVVRGRAGVTDNDYAYYLTISPDVRTFAISQMTGSSGRQRVPTLALGGISVLLPPLPEQRRIAKILGDLDDKIELNRKMNETLEQMARALFKSWFIDFDPVRAKMEGRQPPGMDADTAALFPSRLVESELGLVPEGWEVKALDSIASFLNGLALQKYPPSDGNTLKVIKIAQLRSGNTHSGDVCSAEIPDAYIIDDGDVLFSWSGSLEIEIWCGGVGALNQHLFKVTSNAVPQWFYYQWLRHHLPTFREIAADKATTMGHIQRKHLAETFALVPSAELVNAMTSIMKPVHSQVLNNNIQSRTLASLRDTLLPQLMRGEGGTKTHWTKCYT